MSADKILSRVRALLAKANSTEHPEEAETFFAKAQEMITLHQLAEADLIEGDPIARTEVVMRNFDLEGSYQGAQAHVWWAAAAGTGAYAVRYSQGSSQYRMEVWGSQATIDATEMLATSMLLHVTGAAVKAGSQWVDTWEGRRNVTRSWRRSFIMGFAQRMQIRLAAQRRKTTEADVTGAALVLVSEQDQAKAAATEQDPNISAAKDETSNWDGYRNGDQSARNFNIAPRVGRNTRGALNT
jgi:hypothetical protein